CIDDRISRFDVYPAYVCCTHTPDDPWYCFISNCCIPGKKYSIKIYGGSISAFNKSDHVDCLCNSHSHSLSKQYGRQPRNKRQFYPCSELESRDNRASEFTCC